MESKTIPKEDQVWELLKEETTASAIQGRLGINYYRLLDWLDFQTKKGKLVKRKDGNSTYFKIKEDKK